jgi:hypothetical protein
MPSIEAIIFDGGGVMAQVAQPALFGIWEERLGLEPGSLYEILWQSPEWQLAEVGAITDGEYWQRIGARLHLPGPGMVQQLQD